MGLFDTGLNINPSFAAPEGGVTLTTPALTAPAVTATAPAVSLLPAGGVSAALAPTAATGATGNPMALLSLAGMIAGAIGGPNSPGGRVGAGLQQHANGSMMAQAMLEREQGQRDFLAKLLKAHGDSKATTDSLLGLTPKDTGGGVSGGMGGV